MPRPDEPAHDAEAAARLVARALRDVLGDDLFAAYLHGSAVMGGFRWDRSDLDILALSRTAVSDEQVASLAAALATLSYPANGLEFSLMAAHQAAAPEVPAPRFQVHVATGGQGHDGRVVDGRTGAGDPDLVLELAVCRERSVTLLGPPASSVVARIPHPTMLLAMRNEIDWARANASLEYLVLTSARAWLFADTQRLASKIEAGEWALERADEPAVIAAALSRQRGAEAVIERDAAERLAAYVDRLIRGQAARGAV
jgi:Domain of unknown function (DUF4111)